MKVRLMFHDDWELYGDGSGDIEELMFNPARQIMDLCDRFGVRYTFFAEIGQQFAMRASTTVQDAKSADTWEKLLIQAVKRGHDVQLHLHPQWIGASRDGNRWNLDLTKCSITRMGREDMVSCLRKGADYLRGLLKPHNQAYEVLAFRGGGFMVQPSENLLWALKTAGILADVTVVPGMKVVDHGFGGVDFTQAFSNIRPWFPGENDFVTAKEKYENFFCIPTYSRPISIPVIFFSFFTNPLSLSYSLRKHFHEKKKSYIPLHQWKTSTSGDSPIPTQCNQTTTVHEPIPPLLKRLFKKKFIFCDFGQMHWSTILTMVDEAIRQGEREGLEEMPLILYTHSKQFYSFQNFETLLRNLVKNKKVTFETTRSTVRYFHGKFLEAEKRLGSPA